LPTVDKNVDRAFFLKEIYSKYNIIMKRNTDIRDSWGKKIEGKNNNLLQYRRRTWIPL